MSGVALVTGATSGLGRELAFALADKGWTVLVHGRDEARSQAVVEQLQARGTTATPYLADLSSLAQVAALAAAVNRDHAQLDLVVNNAGVGAGRSGGSRETSADGYELRLAVNFLAPVLLTRSLQTPLQSAGTGAQVLNIGSVGQSPVDRRDPQLTKGWDGMTAYVKSKFALSAYSLWLAEQWRGEVNVNCVHPATYMDTAMVRESGVAPWASVAEGRNAVLKVIDAGRSSTGLFYDGARAARSHGKTYDRAEQLQLLELADQLITAAT